MDKNSWWKWLILGVMLTFSMYLVIPPSEKIKKGIDLQGGTSFTVEVDTNKMFAVKLEQAENASSDQTNKVRDAIAKELPEALEKAKEVIRNRIDNLGIAEPNIYLTKNRKIIVQLPGISMEQQADAEIAIKSVAFLEFRLVHEKNSQLVRDIFEKNQVPEGYYIDKYENDNYFRRDTNAVSEKMLDREKLKRFKIPDAGHEMLLEKTEINGNVYYRPFFVKRKIELTGSMLKSAQWDNYGQGFVVNLRFNMQGAKKFASVTGNNVGRQLAIILDGTLYSAPVIKDEIVGGNAEISGRFSIQDAKLLANILNAGSLPVPVDIIERHHISASLGKDAVKSGYNAALWGSLGVIVFMMFYYRLCGIIANIALLLNFLLMPVGVWLTAYFLEMSSGAGLFTSSSKLPVLTLPGIAGIALTIGMAVDANVLIFERIREELSAGKSLAAAVIAGYEKAFSAILDSNLTTILSALILFYAGTGPVRGYSVTLCAGLIISMFTAITVTRLIFGLLLEKYHLTTVTMLRLMTNMTINYLGKMKPALVISLVVIVVSWSMLISKEMKNPGCTFGIDFTGGTSVMFDYKTRVSEDEIRKVFSDAGAKDIVIQYVKDVDGTSERLQVKAGNNKVGEVEPLEFVKKAISEKFTGQGYVVASEDSVGAQVGAQFKKNALVAVLISLVGMIVYITIRFEFGFALGVIVALIHDVLITVGVFSLLGYQFSLTFLAAVLTVIGYSANDTIVIFDRIRENLRLVKNQTFTELSNLSVNQTMSRTILTNLATMITVVTLMVFGGGTIFDFSLALFIGMISGTYSTIYIATPVVIGWHKGKRPNLGVNTVTK